MSVNIEKLSVKDLSTILLQASLQAKRKSGVAMAVATIPVQVDLVATELLAILRGEPAAEAGPAAEPPSPHATPLGGNIPVPASGVPLPTPTPGLGVKSIGTIRHVHDRISMILGEGGKHLEEEGRHYLSNIGDALCWILGCPGNRFFAANLATLSRALWKNGMRSSVAAPLDPGAAWSLRLAGERFVLVRQPARLDIAGAGIQCLTCLSTSWHPDDAANLFCSRCKSFHDELLDADLAELDAWSETNRQERDGGGVIRHDPGDSPHRQ